MSDTGTSVPLSVDLSQASIDALVSALSKAFATGAKQGSTRMAEEMGRGGKAAGSAWTKNFMGQVRDMESQLEGSIKRAMSGVTASMGRAVADMASTANINMTALARTARALENPSSLHAASTNPNARMAQATIAQTRRTMETQATAQLQAQLKLMSETTAKETAQIKSDAKLKAVAEGTSGKLQTIEARKNADILVREERTAGELRVATRKAALKTLTNIEKAIGASVSGVAKTTTSALSKMASGIGSLFHRSNSGFTDGLNSSLNKRESMMRSSFSQQESIVRKSVLRQEALMQEARARTSSGVLGAVTGRGLGMGIGALVGGVGIAAWLKGGYTQAVNLNEQLNKTGVVFGKLQTGFGTMDELFAAWSKNAVNSLGLTKAEALDAAGTFGNLFRATKIGETQSAVMSTTLVQLAADLSSFNNVPVDDALTALRSGLVGEQEPLRKFGINLTEATLKQKALELGLSDGKSVLSANAKAQAAYALILEQSTLAQGDFARTMYEGANAQRRAGKAASELARSIMGTLMPAVTVGMNVATAAFTSLAAVIDNKDNPALHLMKRALMGAAAGMGAVIATKGAVEVFKLMGTAVKFALGPLGLVLTGFGLIGAAVAVLMDRSAALRDTMHQLGGKFSEIGHAIGEKFSGVLKSAGHFIDGTLIPAIDRAATWLSTHLLGAFDATARFVTDKLIPGLKTFAGFVGDTLAPIAVRAGEAIASGFNTAWGAVKNFWGVVRPMLQPLVDGFGLLGKALQGALTGDFSGLGKGLGAAASGIGASVANIASAVMKALAPLATQIWAWLGGVFSAENMKRLAGGFLGLVEEIGKVLGTLITHPTFIKAVLAIGAAAVVIAAKFVQGFAEGVASNLPALWRMLTGAISAGFGLVAKAALQNWWKVLLAGMLLASFWGKIVSAFKNRGEMSAKGFAGGFAANMKQGAILTQSFLNPAYFTDAGKAAGRAASFAMFKSFYANQATLKAGGVDLVKTGFMPNNAQMADAAARVKKLTDGLTDAQKAALAAKTRIQQMVGTLSGAVGHIGDVGKNFQFLRTTGEGVFKSITGSFRMMWFDMKGEAQKQGTTVGAVMGQAIRGAATAALAGLGGYMAGKAEGSSGGSGIMSALMSGLGAFAVTGNPIIGAVAGGAALLGAAFGQSSKAAKEAAERVKGFASVVHDILVPSAEDGKVAISDLWMAASGDKAKAFGEGLAAAVQPETLKRLNQLGISAEDIRVAMLRGDAAVEQLLNRIGGPGWQRFAFGPAAEVKAAIAGANAEVVNFNEALKFTSTDGALSFSSILTGITAVEGALKAAAADAADVIANQHNEALKNAAIDATKAGDALTYAKNMMDGVFRIPGENPLQQTFDNALLAVKDLGPQLQAAFQQGTLAGDAEFRNLLRGLGSNVETVIAAGIENGMIVDATSAQFFTQGLLDAALAGVTDPKLRQQIIDSYNSALSAVVPTIDTYKSAEQGKRFADAVQAYLNTHKFATKAEAEIEVKKVFATLASLAHSGKSTLTDAFMTGKMSIQADVFISDQSAKIRGDLEKTGKAISDGLYWGQVKSAYVAAAGGAYLAETVKRRINQVFGIHSPSTVMIGVGENLGLGLAQGIQTGAAYAVSAAAAMAAAVSAAASDGIAAGGRTLFDSVTGSRASLNTVSPVISATAGITDAMQSFLSTTHSSLSSAIDAWLSPDPNDPSKKNIAGESPVSLNANDVLGAANVTSLTGALDAIASLGSVLISQGTDAATVASTLQSHVDDLTAAAAAAGFNSNEVLGLVDALGLSNTALSNLVQQVQLIPDAVAALPDPSTYADTGSYTDAGSYPGSSAGSSSGSISMPEAGSTVTLSASSMAQLKTILEAVLAEDQKKADPVSPEEFARRVAAEVGRVLKQQVRSG